MYVGEGDGVVWSAVDGEVENEGVLAVVGRSELAAAGSWGCAQVCS